MDVKQYTISGVQTSLQVGEIGNIPSGNFTPSFNFLVKNITDENIVITVITSRGTTIETVLYPGWNPEILKGINNVVENTLQYGY